MALLPPRVIGPLSECSSAVRVEGQITGSTVEIFADGASVGGDAASWSSQIFQLNPGVTLTAGARVTAKQTTPGDGTSAPSPEPVEVQARPPVIGHVGFRSHLYVCGECLWLEGMVPGATVEVKLGGIVRGSGTAYDGTARIGLAQPIGPGEAVEAQQTACGNTGPSTLGPPPDPTPVDEKRQLPAPTIVPPLRECQRAVLVTDVFEGARVTLNRSAAPNPTACFDAKSLWFRTAPLVLSETVSARQEFMQCDANGQDSPTFTVESAEPVPPPVVVGPLCDGGVYVTVTDLIPGSKFRLFQDGIELGTGETPDGGSGHFFVDPPLSAGTTITARQELCDNWSAASNGVEVDRRPASLPKPRISEPLFECGAVVHVENLHPGVGVYVYSDSLGAPIGWVHAHSAEADVPVAPLLIAGDRVYAVQLGCGLTSERSDTVEVLEVPALRPPTVRAPIDTCMTSIIVTDVVPGARVDVYVNGAWRGTKAAGEDTVEVPIWGWLEGEDQVQARQRLCDKVTELSRPVTVVVNTTGYWTGPFSTPVFAVHAALVYNRETRKAKVLMFSGGEESQRPLDSYLWSPDTHAFGGAIAWNSRGIEDDLFCAHHSFLADGRLLVMGGSKYNGPHAEGIKATYIFDPVAESWTKSADMDNGRWYPTAVTMSDGKVLVFSGLDDNGIVKEIEIFSPSPSPGTWGLLPDSANQGLKIYPSMHLVPSGTHAGKVFYSGTRWAGSSDANDPWAAPDSQVFDPSSNNWQNIDGHVEKNRTEGTSVLLPGAEDGRVLVLGGGQRASDGEPHTAEIIDLTGPDPEWTTTPDMPSDRKRTNVNAVILPDSTVFVLGGHQRYKWDSDPDPVLETTIYHPNVGTGTWTPAATMSKPRQYHSVALLLPDGRVLSAGGVVPTPRDDQEDMEIYYPPYMCRERPEISSAPDDIFYDLKFNVGTPQAVDIDKVVLVRPSAITHHTDSEQRLVELKKSVSGTGQLVVTAPANGNLAPPGNYMLFVVNNGGTPSTARFVRLARPNCFAILVGVVKRIFGR